MTLIFIYIQFMRFVETSECEHILGAEKQNPNLMRAWLILSCLEIEWLNLNNGFAGKQKLNFHCCRLFYLFGIRLFELCQLCIANKPHLNESFAMVFGPVNDGTISSTKCYSYILLRFCKWIKNMCTLLRYNTFYNITYTRKYSLFTFYIYIYIICTQGTFIQQILDMKAC